MEDELNKIDRYLEAGEIEKISPGIMQRVASKFHSKHQELEAKKINAAVEEFFTETSPASLDYAKFDQAEDATSALQNKNTFIFDEPSKFSEKFELKVLIQWSYEFANLQQLKVVGQSFFNKTRLFGNNLRQTLLMGNFSRGVICLALLAIISYGLLNHLRQFERGVNNLSTSVEAATPEANIEPDSIVVAALDLTPRSASTNIGKNIAIQIWDEADYPVGDTYVQLRENGLEVSGQYTNWIDGKSILEFDAIPVGSILSLYIDPSNHTNPLLNEENSFEFVADMTVFGKTFCFKRTNQLTSSGQKPIYVLINCPEAELLAMRDGDTASKPNTTPPAAPSLLYFNETFDVNSRGWEEWADQTAENEIRGHNFFANGAFNMNLLSSADWIIHETKVPLEKEIKNFGLFLRFSSVVQPQKVDGVARLNIKFQIQQDGSHYNLSINHKNMVTLYYIFLEDGETKSELIDHFQSEYYLAEPNAENSLNLLVEQESIRIFINEEEERTISTVMRYIDQAGGISIAIDATAGNVVSYKLNELNIKEWSEI